MSKDSDNLRAFASSRETKREETRPALVPKLRFPGFRTAEGWEENAFGDPPNLSAQQIEGIKTYIPRLPEQQRIADCLTRLDDLIAAQTQTLEALKTHKQGLMQ